MRDRNQMDWNVWLDTYKDTYASFTRAQQQAFRALEALARFNYAVAGDVLEAGFARVKATLGSSPDFSTQSLAELLEKQAEVGTQLSEKFRERTQEFSTLAAEVDESVGSFASATTQRAAAAQRATTAQRGRGNGRSHAARKAA